MAVGTVGKVKFEAYDGDVHLDLRLDPGYETARSTTATTVSEGTWSSS